ncbi:MAG: YopX family protein [Bacillota bacterium]|nr:YopX family protein [Bacillota bacterium]
MGREIKFRGKRVDGGEWVYGSLHYTEFEYTTQHFKDGANNHFLAIGAAPVIEVQEDNSSELLNDYRAIPESVGQFTGIHDKNGREIYEGDVIQGKYNGILIKWGRTGFLPYRNKDGGWSKVTNWNSVQSGEVIGNIYENPELLKGGE